MTLIYETGGEVAALGIDHSDTFFPGFIRCPDLTLSLSEPLDHQLFARNADSSCNIGGYFTSSVVISIFQYSPDGS